MFINKEYIFEAYVLTKGEPVLKQLILDEGNQKKIQKILRKVFKTLLRN